MSLLVKHMHRTLGWAGVLTVLLAFAAPAAAGVWNEVAAADPAIGDRVKAIEQLIESDNAQTLPLPPLPRQALISALDQLSAAAGFGQDSSGQILAAPLSDEVIGRLANVVSKALACFRVTDAHWDALPHDEASLRGIVLGAEGLDPAQLADIQDCSFGLWTATLNLETSLETMQLASPASCTPLGPVSIDLWPVLRFEGTCTGTTYLNDYMVTVELGGSDTYINNVGSNMVDLNFAPASSAVPGIRGFGPAEGCQRAIPGLAAADCTPAVAVLLDMQGSDTFGVKQTPDHDTGCTNDLLVRRLVTVGVGFLGVGILRDAADPSSDTYTGKTGAVGAGHIFGVGILSDAGGNDKYLAIRNSQGFALAGGVGILRDEAGADSYDFYMPAPIDPDAENQEEGAGGARDDEGEGLCDRIPRFTLGAANVAPGTIGVLVDDRGTDSYRCSFSQTFEAPGNQSAAAGCLGFGANEAAAGVFLDRGGTTDTYIALEEAAVTGVAARGNGVTLAGAAPPLATTSTGTNAGAGAFIDR